MLSSPTSWYGWQKLLAGVKTYIWKMRFTFSPYLPAVFPASCLQKKIFPCGILARHYADLHKMGKPVHNFLKASQYWEHMDFFPGCGREEECWIYSSMNRCELQLYFLVTQIITCNIFIVLIFCTIFLLYCTLLLRLWALYINLYLANKLNLVCSKEQIRTYERPLNLRLFSLACLFVWEECNSQNIDPEEWNCLNDNLLGVLREMVHIENQLFLLQHLMEVDVLEFQVVHAWAKKQGTSRGSRWIVLWKIYCNHEP